MSNQENTTAPEPEPTGLADFPFPVVYLDNESTGLDPERHSLYEIGAVSENKQFELRFRPRPGSQISEEAIAVNGMDSKQLDAIQMSYFEGIQEFFQWVKSAFGQQRNIVIAGMNPAKIELAFIKEAWGFMGWQERNFPFSHRTLDAFTMALSVPEIAEKLAERCGSKVPSAFDLDAVLCLPYEPEPHTALTGARRTAQRFYLLQNAARGWHSAQPDKHIDWASPAGLSICPQRND